MIALFPCEPSDVAGLKVESYMHVGQHSEASRNLGQNLRLASPEEYAPLLRELRAIYKPIVVRSVHRLRA